MRHYIGRLGSWWNACVILVSTARRDPSMFLEAQVKGVSHRMSLNLDQFGGRTEPARAEYAPDTQEEQGVWLALAPALLAQQWGDSAAAEFVDRFQRRRVETIIHAELLVLDHFHQHAFEFAQGVRYIGCSKLSCYCCHVYMRVHPWTLLPRPCHGNTWTRWAMPMRTSNGNARSRAQDARMLVEMIRQTSREIEAGSFATTVVKHLESTTGIDPEFSDHDG